MRCLAEKFISLCRVSKPQNRWWNLYLFISQLYIFLLVFRLLPALHQSKSNSLFLWTVLFDEYLLIFIYSHLILALARRQPWVLHVIFLLLSWKWFISTTVEIHQLKIGLIRKPFTLDSLYLSKNYDWNSEHLHLSTYTGSWIKTRMCSRHIKTFWKVLKIKGRFAQILRFFFPFSSHRSRHMQTYNREIFQEK